MSSTAIWRKAVHDKIWLVGASGRLDHNSVPRLEEVLAQLLAEGWLYFIMDLSEADYVNSSGLRVLVSTWRTVRQRGGVIHLVGLTSRVQEIFEMVQFNEIFRTFDAPGDALESIIDSWHD